MFSFGLVASNGDRAPNQRRLDVMMASGPIQASDGVVTATASHAAAGLSRWVVSRRDLSAAPHWDPERQLLVTGDVRLYNRPELASELGLGAGLDERSDLELARLAYGRWGDGVCRHLVGDFAFVVWDERRRSLFMARDHLGVRPLLYRLAGETVFAASDARQLLPFLPDVLHSVNEQMLFELFTRHIRHGGMTYFKGISSLPPGHYARWDGSRVRESRYWFPPRPSSAPRTYEENCAVLRETFGRAVRDRLESDAPLIAHSSGGWDSSSILMVADRTYRTEPARPPLTMASALTIGLPSDDSEFMDVIGKAVSFEGVRWNALEPTLADVEDPILPLPGFRSGPGGGPRTDLDVARARGARVLLGGACGDGVMYSWGVFRDLFRHSRFGSLLRETVGRHPLGHGGRLLIKATLGALPPRQAFALGQRIFGRPKEMPAWMGPRFRELYPPRANEAHLPENVDWSSHLACEAWARLTGPHFGAVLDAAVLYGTNEGLEVRLPYSDVRLVEHVLSIPWDQRIPAGNQWGLRRDALGPIMPVEFMKRTRQGAWTNAWATTARATFSHAARMLADGTWLSAPYVDRAFAASWLRSLTQAGDRADPMGCLYLSEFAVLEAWLRRLLRYDAAREVEP